MVTGLNKNTFNKAGFKASLLLMMVLVSACTQHHALREPHNASGKMYGNRFENGEVVNHQNPKEMVFSSQLDCTAADFEFKPAHFRADKPLLPSHSIVSNQNVQHLFNKDLPLSPGDMIDLQIEYGEGFSGRYVINPDGSLQLPALPSIQVAGLTSTASAEKIELALVRAQIFRPTTA